jgi:hypothetical protein
MLLLTISTNDVWDDDETLQAINRRFKIVTIRLTPTGRLIEGASSLPHADDVPTPLV